MTEIPFCTLDFACPYLDGRAARSEYLYIKDCDFEYNSSLVQHGYRRFGRYFQKPICAACAECKSLRVDAANFKFSRSHRRVYKNNHTTAYVWQSRPLLNDARLELFALYHDYMHLKKGWPLQEIDFERYDEIYVQGHGDFGKEISYYGEDGRLICVDLIDIVDDGISSVYCYYDPYLPHLSLGKFSLLKQIEFARDLGLRWIYLGYAVEQCPSLAYKFSYKPYEILNSYVELDAPAVWEGCIQR